MSLNLGNGHDAARKLHLAAEATFQEVREAILEQSRKAMNIALECPHEARVDAIGYARALRDIYLALESGATGQMYQKTEKPGPLPLPVGGKR